VDICAEWRAEQTLSFAGWLVLVLQLGRRPDLGHPGAREGVCGGEGSAFDRDPGRLTVNKRWHVRHASRRGAQPHARPLSSSRRPTTTTNRRRFSFSLRSAKPHNGHTLVCKEIQSVHVCSAASTRNPLLRFRMRRTLRIPRGRRRLGSLICRQGVARLPGMARDCDITRLPLVPSQIPGLSENPERLLKIGGVPHSQSSLPFGHTYRV
jgi:hypothetical protein